MANVAVVLSGNGFLDGAEINEVVLTLLHLEKAGAHYDCFAPDIKQHHVIDHKSGEEELGLRNVLQESARIVRGDIRDIAALDAEKYDALVLPGGYGVAKNLSNFAMDGTQCELNQDMLRVAQSFHDSNKVLGLMCIAPVLAPKIVGEGVEVTIGSDENIAQAIQSMGGKHIVCDVSQIHIDHKNKVVSTPAYMLAKNIVQAEQGIEKLIAAVLELSE